MDSVVKSRRLHGHLNMDYQWNRQARAFLHQHRPGLFDVDQTYFQTTVLVCLVALLGVGVCGCVYEVRRRRSDTCGRHVETVTKTLRKANSRRETISMLDIGGDVKS